MDDLTRVREALSDLVDAVDGDRCTLRVDDPSRGWSVQLPCLEILRNGIASLSQEGSINQRAAATVAWLDEHRQVLVQQDLENAVPEAPPALVKAYKVRAQMLGPLVDEAGSLAGWISVHFLDKRPDLNDRHARRMVDTIIAVRPLIGLTGDHGVVPRAQDS
ncbi:hypothetical protein [Lutibaculum baratangense]|uniref:Asp/Glu racemase n=1 Tax=Lutibaculum baratangense AMV1 TaxID=631454 RepID=V4TGI8_9HYPH|nr:hypothetical protein [Lutibaculum baratangense]ESR25223.1 Asp/Glu racemase [Lutibaculum baratangense AMV1]